MSRELQRAKRTYSGRDRPEEATTPWRSAALEAEGWTVPKTLREVTEPWTGRSASDQTVSVQASECRIQTWERDRRGKKNEPAPMAHMEMVRIAMMESWMPTAWTPGTKRGDGS